MPNLLKNVEYGRAEQYEDRAVQSGGSSAGRTWRRSVINLYRDASETVKRAYYTFSVSKGRQHCQCGTKNLLDERIGLALWSLTKYN